MGPMSLIFQFNLTPIDPGNKTHTVVKPPNERSCLAP